MHTEAIHPAVRVGHVHLRVADLDRAIGFYRDALGFAVTADARPLGMDAVFLAAGDYHHHIGLNTWESRGASPPPPGHTGLYHVAFLYPDRRELGRAVRRLLDHGIAVDHATDHGGTVAVYLDDHDGNDPECLTVIGVDASPEQHATWAAQWLLRQLRRPVVREEWLRDGQVVAHTLRLSDTGTVLARHGSSPRRLFRRPPDQVTQLR